MPETYEENEYGIKKNEFIVKQPVVISLEIIDLLKAYFGEDINTTSTEPVVRIAQEVARVAGHIWGELEGKLNEQTPVSSSGKWIEEQAKEKNLSRKVAKKAQTTLRFDKTNNQTVSIPMGTIVDNGGSGAGLVEFETLAAQNMPAVFRFLKGGENGKDYFSQQAGYENFFNILDVEWVADNGDGSSPYIEGTDYVTYTSEDDCIDWSPTEGAAKEPTTGAFYYVKVIGCSINIPAQCKVAGVKGIVEAGTLNHLQTFKAGITNVTNENASQKGTDAETDVELRGRVLSAPMVLKNDEDLASKIKNIDGVNTLKIIEDIALFEVIVAFDYTPVIQSVYNSIIDLIQEQKTISSQPFAIIRIKKGTVNGLDPFPAPYIGVWKVLWVSDKEDGSSPYIEGTDYKEYSPNDDQIDWSLGGNEPLTDDYYFVKIVQGVTIAEEVNLDFEGELTLTRSNFTLAGIEEEIGANFRTFLRGFDIDDDIYKYDFSERVTTVEGVKILQNFKITAIVRITKGIGNGMDDLPCIGTDIVDWISDEKDGSNPYTITTDYTVDKTNNQIDWSPVGTNSEENLVGDVDSTQTDINVTNGSSFSVGDVIQIDLEQMKITEINSNTLTVIRGYNSTTPAAHDNGADIYIVNEPSEGNYYYVKVIFTGDLVIGQREIAVLGNLNFTVV